MKRISYGRALLVGLLAIFAQLVTFYVRFGVWNTVAPISTYVFFFLAGSLGGWILIEFLNRQETKSRRWVVLTAFLLASPIALFLMIAGGLLGPIGVLVLPQIPWTILTLIGSWAAKFVARG